MTVVSEGAAYLAGGVRAHEADGDLQSARHWFESAYREGERTGDVAMMAEAVLGLGGVWVDEHRTAAGRGLMRARLQHVLSLVDPDGPLALRLRARLAAEADYRAGRYESILEVLAQARRSGDPLARTEALSLAHHCLLAPEHAQLRRALADELVGEAARTGRRTDLLMGLLWQTVDAYLDADPLAERYLTELRGMLDREEHLAVGFVVRALDVMLAIRRGRLDTAEALAHECYERGEKAGDVDAAAWHGAQLVAIRWYQGRLTELLPNLAELVDSTLLSAVDYSFVAAYAVAAARSGDRDAAEAALAKLRGPGLADLPRSSSWLVTMYGVAEAAYLVGNAMAAQRAYNLLRPYSARPMMASLGVACFGSAHHALGVAALAMGNVDRAVGHLREAVHRNLALGHLPAAALSRHRLAEALALRSLPEDVVPAREQGDRAREMADALGLVLPGTPEPEPEGQALTCTRHGRRWRLGLGTRTALVDHSVGMLHLAVLTANPGSEVAAIDLVAGVDALGQAARNSRMSTQEVLDRTAVQRYRQRLAELSRTLDELEARGDRAGAERARTERDWVLGELNAGTGLGGRPRAFSDNAERARLAVGRAIRRAIAHVELAEPRIGEHLRASVHTGTRCWYRPV